MTKFNAENIDKPADDAHAEDVADAEVSSDALAASQKIQRRPVPPPTWPKIPEGAAGTAAAFGAWKTVTHSGRKI